MKEMVALLVDNGVCSVGGKIPVFLEAHVERFSKLIKRKNVIIGRKAFETLNCYGFPQAKNTIILSRNTGKHKYVEYKSSIVSLLDSYNDFIVVGGQSVFADFMPIADKLYITEVSETASDEGAFKMFPSIRNFKLENPDAEILVEGDHYFRFLEYKRK